MKRKDSQLVMIEWIDSRSPAGQWQKLVELGENDYCKCVSVGFLLKDNKKVKVLAPNMADLDDPNNLQASGIIVIPSRCVTRIKSLEERN